LGVRTTLAAAQDPRDAERAGRKYQRLPDETAAAQLKEVTLLHLDPLQAWWCANRSGAVLASLQTRGSALGTTAGRSRAGAFGQANVTAMAGSDRRSGGLEVKPREGG